MQAIPKKKRVLFVGPYPPPYAGPEMAMKTLLESSLKDKFLISFFNTNVRSSNAEKGKFDLILIKAFFLFIFRLLFIIATKKPELVYYFVTATRLGWLGKDIWCIFIARLFGAKIVIHLRAGHFKNNYQNCNLIEQKIIRFACSFVALGLVQAKCLRKQFEGLIEDHKIVAVYNAIDTDKYQNEKIDSYNPNMILFLGHLSFAKGYCDILKVIPTVIQRFPNIKFVFAGSIIRNERNVFHNQITGQHILFEDPKECYKKYLLEGNKENYTYLGMVNEQEKINLLKRCNFLLLPSYSEGFSMAVLEALTLGKPVLCTPVGALGEIVQNEVNGLIVPPGDIKSLEQAVCRLLSDQQLRNKIAATNYYYSRDHFSKNLIGDQIASIFDEVIGIH